MRWTSLAAAVLFAPLAFAATAQEAVAPLTRPDGAVQPEARGNCNVRDGSDFQRFTLVVEGVNADRALELFLGDGNEHLFKIGDMPAGANRREFNRTTREGGELPYGVESVRTLGGRAVEVRDGEAHVVLRGHVPVLEAPPVDPPPVDPPAAEPLVARSVFHRTEFAGERESRGAVVVTKRTDGGALRVEVGRLAPETGYLFSVGARGSMTLVDDFRTNREGGAAIERDTAHEPGLPLGADGVGGLAGKRIEIRDLADNVVLYGEIPGVETVRDVEPVHETEHAEDPETGTDVDVTVRIEPERGHEEVVIVVRDIPRETDAPAAKRRTRRKAELRMDDGTGTIRTVAQAQVRGGRARIRITTRGGRELPLGVESLRDLAGRGFDVVVGSTRTVSGTLPQF